MSKYYSSSSNESSSSRSYSRSHSRSQSEHKEYSQSDRSSSSSSSRSPVNSPKHSPPKKKTRKKSAYFFFCDKERKKIMKENPTWRLPQVSKELGKRWRTLEDRKKRRYHKLAEEQ